MNREQILAMAREATGSHIADYFNMSVCELERFAALVAAAEREACIALHNHEDVQAPSVPDVAQTIPSHDQLTKILNGLDRCVAAESKREFLRVWIRDWTAHKIAAAPTPVESTN